MIQRVLPVVRTALWALPSLVLVLSATATLPADAKEKGLETLVSVYAVAKPVLDDSSQENPFYLQAKIVKYRQTGEAAMYFEQPLSELADSLSDISNWCDVLILHLNTKACTYNLNKSGENTLTIYLGRKFYQDPDDAFVMKYRFQTERQDNYFSALITAKKGPLGTSDYRIQLEVADMEGKTFGRFLVSQKHSWISSKAAKLYVATTGRDKKGISVVGHNDAGNPIYSDGELGIAERNLLRYYFAFTAFFSARNDPEENQFKKRMNNWYDQTERYEQLYEVDRKQYIGDKEKELQNQLALQSSQYQDQETGKNR